MSDWKNVQYKDGKFQTSTGGGGGGSSTFAGLDDVNFSNVQNGQVPKYNSTTHKWENANESGGGGTVTDVQVDGVSVVNQQGVAEIEMPTPPTIPVEDVEVNGESVVNAQNVAEIKSYKEVTQAEYQALPSSKLTDNILYCIKDSAGADGFPPLIYSDEEREVGVWRDGKPLYGKVTTFGAIAAGTSNSRVPSGASNIDTMVEYKVYVTEYGNKVSLPYPLFASTDNYSQYSINCQGYDPVNNNFRIDTGREISVTDGYIIFMYTKTTDTPGSGTWTTQGGYAHHYSTTEQIIGTYNGKPLYQKSFFGVDFVNGRRDYQHGIANVDKIFIDNSATFIYKKDKTESGPFLFAGYNDQAQFVEGYGRIIQVVTPTVIIMKANANIYSDYTADITVRYTKTTD